MYLIGKRLQWLLFLPAPSVQPEEYQDNALMRIIMIFLCKSLVFIHKNDGSLCMI